MYLCLKNPNQNKKKPNNQKKSPNYVVSEMFKKLQN